MFVACSLFVSGWCFFRFAISCFLISNIFTEIVCMCLLQAPSLLDLPELALHEIGRHLSQADLAQCMQTCSMVNALFRPQLSALVSARHLGRKWVLRACGRALFRAVGERWEAGEMKLDSVGRLVEDHHLEEQRQKEQRVLARRAAQSGMEIRGAWARWKAYGIVQPVTGIYIDDLAYLSNLAEYKNFSTVVDLLDQGCRKNLHSFSLSRFLGRRDLPNSSPKFFAEGTCAVLKSADFISLELISCLWLVSFLVSLDDGFMESSSAEDLESVIGSG